MPDTIDPSDRLDRVGEIENQSTARRDPINDRGNDTGDGSATGETPRKALGVEIAQEADAAG